MKRAIQTALSLTTASFLSVMILARPAGAAFRWDIPDWIPPPAVPADNPITPAKVELGRISSTINVYRLTRPWRARLATTKNAPSPTASAPRSASRMRQANVTR